MRGSKESRKHRHALYVNVSFSRVTVDETLRKFCLRWIGDDEVAYRTTHILKRLELGVLGLGNGSIAGSYKLYKAFCIILE